MNKVTYILIFFSLIIYSQDSNNDNYIFEGNKKIEINDFTGAEIDYRNSLSKDPNSTKALYNLGNSQYNSLAYDEAIQQFFRTQKFSKDKSEKHSGQKRCTLSSVVEHGAYDAAAMGSNPIGCIRHTKGIKFHVHFYFSTHTSSHGS